MTSRSRFLRSRVFQTLKLTALVFQGEADVPDTATCTATYKTDGDIAGDLLGSHALEYIDIQGAGFGFLYEVNYSSVTGDTGDLTGAALDTFHALTSERSYILTASGLPDKSVTGTLTIREILNTSNSVSTTKTMDAVTLS